MSSEKIVIIDYGMGNLASVLNAFRFLGFDAEVSDRPERLVSAPGLVLPGVGAFGDAVKNLSSSGLAEVIKEEIGKGKPYLGICLGYQLLFEGSEEDAGSRGLGLFKGKVIRFKAGDMKVPHIGWNLAEKRKDDPILAGLKDPDYFYFVHSYYPAPEDPGLILTETEYGDRFASSVSRGNVFAFQFHPEKSQDAGLAILKNFGEICAHYSSH